jgi:hypothetical protein
MRSTIAKRMHLSTISVHVRLTLAKKVRLVSFSHMGFATGGYPSKDPRALEGRVSTLERLLGSVRLIRITTSKKALQVLGKEDGPVDAGSGCGNLSLFLKNGSVMISPGQVAGELVEEKSLGSLSSLKEKFIAAKISINGTTGKLSHSIETLSSIPGYSDTEQYLAIGRITEDREIVQMICGPISVIVCRNWYAGKEPYFGMSISASYG